MSNASSKKSFGFYIVLLAAVLALAAGVYFLVIHGTFGLDSTHNGDCYDPIITGSPDCSSAARQWPCA